MRKLLLIIMLGLCITDAQAQSFFNRRDPFHSFSSILTSVVPNNGKYYCAGITWDSSNYIGNNQAWPVWGVRFAVYDAAGMKVRDTVYQRSFIDLGTAQGRSIDPWPNTMQRAPDSNFILAAYSYDYDSPFNIRTAIIKLDTMGRCTMFREYEKRFCQSVKADFSNSVHDLKPDGYGGWLLLTRPLCRPGSPSARYDYALTKLDSAFDVVWDRQYNNGSANAVVNKILVEPDGYLLAGGRNNVYQTTINFTHQAQLIKTDTAGNVVWTWLSDPAKKIYSAADVVRTSDGGYLYCGMTGIETPSANGQHGEMTWKGWIEKLDGNRISQWNRTTSDFYTSEQLTALCVLHQTSGGDIMVAGSVVDTSYTTYTKQRAALMRIAADGTLRWERHYHFPADTFRCFVHDMKPASDGGFVMVGQSVDPVAPYNPPTQQGWIIKVDSNGCLGLGDSQCWPTAVASIPSKDEVALVYPNPATSTLNVRYPPKIAQATMHVTDLTGRRVLQSELQRDETPLGISHLHPGLYLWRITEGGLEKAHGKFVKE